LRRGFDVDSLNVALLARRAAPLCVCAQGLPLQCSVFLTRHEGLLQRTNSSNADYLFQPDKLHADMVRATLCILCWVGCHSQRVCSAYQQLACKHAAAKYRSLP